MYKFKIQFFSPIPEQNQQPLHWRDRPMYIRDSIELTYQKLNQEPVAWPYDGFSINPYFLAGINEYKLVEKIIKDNPQQKTFWVLDIGAGKFGFGKGLSWYLNQMAHLPVGVEIHIYSLTAEPTRFPQRVLKNGVCYHHEINSFKIENLCEELVNIGLAPDQLFDCIVSRLAFIHFVDPMGTFLQAYSLLKPQTGYLLMDGFSYPIEESRLTLLDFSSLIPLIPTTQFLMCNSGGHQTHFILQKMSHELCSLPLSYQQEPNMPLDIQRTIPQYLTPYTPHFAVDSVLRKKKCYPWQYYGDECLFDSLLASGVMVREDINKAKHYRGSLLAEEEPVQGTSASFS